MSEAKGMTKTMKIYGKNGDDNSVDKEMEELLKQYSDKLCIFQVVKKGFQACNFSLNGLGLVPFM